MTESLRWKPDWPMAREAFVRWWEHQDLALSVTAPKDTPWENVPAPAGERNFANDWLDPDYWVQAGIHQLSRTFFGGIAFPCLPTCIGGPGSLGLFLGAIGHPAPSTLWYEPVIHDPDNHPPLRLDRSCAPWALHLQLLRDGLRLRQSRFTVGLPDLIENIDTLAQLREAQLLLVDLVERSAWVTAKIGEINQAFFEAYDAMYDLVRDPWGGSAFCAFAVWGPGKVAKVQCDFSCMISAEMFREFVMPALTEQCAWLDHSLYHLDGTQALHHLETLLAIEPLDAIEWTPQAGLEGGGSPRWYDLYRRIKAAGKSVQAVGVKLAEVEPLIEAVGREGLYIMCHAGHETEARDLLRRVGWRGDA